jgi:TPR repeat protein
LLEKDVMQSRFLGEDDYAELWERAADLGHPEAIADLGFLHEKGLEG